MARLFDDVQTEYLEINQAVVSGTPFATVFLFNTNDDSGYQTPFFLGDKDVDAEFFEVILNKDDHKIWAITQQAGGVWAITSTNWSLNTWHHACAIFASSTDRRVLIDGGGKGTNATDKTPAGLDRTSIGRRGRLSATHYVSGLIAEAAIWDLSDWPGATASDKADNFEKIIGSLAKGFSPLFFSLGLKAYWPLMRDEDIDVVGGYNLTPFNTPSIGSHPPIIYPTGPQFSRITRADITVTPATQALALTQHTPSLAYSMTVFPAAQELVLTQHAPTIIIPVDATVTPGTFELVLTQHTPEIITVFAEIPPIMHKDLIDPFSGGAWLWLAQIVVPGYDTQRITKNTADIRYGKEDYKKWSVRIGKQPFVGDGSIPRIVLQVGQDPDGVIEEIVNASEGAYNGTVKLIRVNEKFLDYEVTALEVDYSMLVAESNTEWVTFVLGIPNPLTQRIPLRIGSSKICPWMVPELFKGVECQYIGPDTSCTGTIVDCRDSKDNAIHWGSELGLDPNVTRM